MVEVLGCYWHSCTCQSELTKEQEEWRDRDGRRFFVLRQMRYDGRLKLRRAHNALPADA